MATRKKKIRTPWRNGFRFGNQSHVVGAAGDNLPQDTPAFDKAGRPRALDFERYGEVDFSLNDIADEYS